MTKSKNTKRALLMSVLSMMLCVAMLAGSTFAWFTDSVSSGKNRIVAGNLDVDLFYKTGDMTDWRDVESLGPTETDPFFRNADGDIILWEPGAIGVTSFKVENVGTLAFKYAFALLAVNYNQLDGRDLRDVIKFAVIEGELPEGFTAENARNLDYSAFPDFTKRSALLPNDGVADSGEDQEIFTVVAYWKPNSDKIDNLYNVSNGKIATELDGTQSDPNWLYLDIDIRLNAWQDTVESDSFDNQYDAMADALDKFPDGCYSVTEHENWVELDIYTGRSTADINISYKGYAPDNTDDRMASWTTGSSGTISPDAANGNTHLIFFKTADKGSFTLTQENYVLPMLPVEEDGTISMRKVLYSANNAAAAASMNADSTPPAVTADLSNPVSVSSEKDMNDVIADLNDGIYTNITVKLTQNIDFDDKKDLSLTKGTLTILGEDYSINVKEVANFKFTVGGEATLNLGADNYGKGLYINCECTYIGNNLIHVSGNATMNICKNVVIDGKGNAISAGCVRIAGSGTVNLLGGTIKDCKGHGLQPGGVIMTGSSEFNMWSGEIKNCSSGSGGGAVRLGDGNRPSDPPATFNMYGGTISNCQGGSAGAILLSDNSVFNMSDGTISECVGTSFAGGVLVGDNAVFNMSGGRIESCEGVNGGGVFMQNYAEFNMSGEAIIDNCESGLGGGVCMIQSSKFNMSGGTIRECVGQQVGGGVLMIHSSKFNMTGGTIENCNGVAGGGVCTESSEASTMSGGTIRGCASQQLGGGVYMEGNVDLTIEDGFKLYGNTAGIAGDDIARQGDDAKLTLGNVNTEVELSDGYAVDGWYIDDPDNRWGSEDYPYDEAKVEAGETTAQFIKAAHGVIAAMKGVGTPGRLLDLYDGEDNGALISKGGAKTVKWLLKNSDLADRINASAPIAAGTKITMAYKGDSTIVKYYYLIVEEDTTSVSLSDFTAMGGSEHFASEDGVKNPIYQFSFVFPETQENMSVWMSDEADNVPNESAVGITFAGTALSAPSGTLEANGTTVTVSGLTGFEADQSDSRHNTNKDLAKRRAVLAVEAVDAQGRNVAMSSDTVVKVGDIQAKVSGGIAAAEITGDGTYTIDVELPQGAVGIRVSLCYTYNNIIYKPMANVLDFITVK